MLDGSKTTAQYSGEVNPLTVSIPFPYQGFSNCWSRPRLWSRNV